MIQKKAWNDSWKGIRPTSVIAEIDGKVVGGILCGHDGRTGCFYHVCVDPAYRCHGIGKSMVAYAMSALKEEHINKITLIAFTKNDIGNTFWNTIGWTKRPDVNYIWVCFKWGKYYSIYRRGLKEAIYDEDYRRRCDRSKRFEAASTAAKIKYQDRTDMAMILQPGSMWMCGDLLQTL